MANEDTKNFNAMLHDSKDMPKIQIITDRKSIEKYGGNKMYFAPPLDYDRVMKRVPYGRVTTVGEIREYFAKQSGADFTEPITAGIFVSIAAWASHQRPGTKRRIEDAEGERGTQRKISGRHRVAEGKAGGGGTCHPLQRPKNIRYYVKDYEKVLFALSSL